VERIEKIFTGIGGTFLISPAEISGKLKSVRAFVFDWDGVFNNGEKNEQGSSNFSEVDSMGTNMLRFSSWLQHQRIPFTAIISGERNRSAFNLSIREHYTACYYKIVNKKEALDHFCNRHALEPAEVAYVFDDVPDISIARICGLGILIQRKASPLFTEYIRGNNFADYITAAESGNFAVRETCELLIGLGGSYDEVMTHRSDNTDVYRRYVDERNKVTTAFFTKEGTAITERHPEK
jgi:3-deoxy-D-manno-octulosonate 8-phosphate phosphatase (KDO 8-P phosphatase)